MRYLLLIGSENKTAAPPSPAEGQAMVQAFMRFSEEVRRAEYGRVVASVLRIVRDIDAAEDVVQEAFAQALDHWPAHGPPDRPGAWLLTTARRRALDRLRRARRADARAEALAYETGLGASGGPEVADPETIPDDRLRL